MKKPVSVVALEELGRVRLSKSFYFRDFLYSEIANHYGMHNRASCKTRTAGLIFRG